MAEKQRNTAFDMLKGLSCIAVVLIHYGFSGSPGTAINSMCRFAVPVFFGISGYFLTATSTISDESVLHKIRHILGVIVTSAVFYAVFFLIWNPLYNRGFDLNVYLSEQLTAGRIVKFFFTNDPIVYSHLWFLLALLYCYLTVLFLFRHGKNSKFFLPLTPVLMLGMMALQEFSVYLSVRSGINLYDSSQTVYLFNLYIFRALPFFMAGMIFRKYQAKIQALPGNLAIWILIAAAGCLLAPVERYLVDKSCQFFLGSYITFFALMIIAVKYPTLKQPFFCYVGKELSMYVYILHIAVGKMYDLVAGRFNLWRKPLYIATKPLVIILCSLMAAWIVALGLRWIKQYIGMHKKDPMQANGAT